MPHKGRDTPADRPRNELEEEEETVQTRQYSQDKVHHYGTAARPRPNGEVNDDCEFGSVEEDGDEDGSILKQFLQDQLYIYIRGASRRGLGSVVGESYDGRGGRAQVVDPSRKSWWSRTTVVQRSLQSVVKESRRRRAV